MYQKTWEHIINSKRILLVSHVSPDGDTLGSVLALYDVLKRLGKKVSLYNGTKELSRIYDFLPNINRIKDTMPKYFDLVISCDCGSFDRLKIDKGDYTLINIDHHLSNKNFGDINIVDFKCASAGMVVYRLLTENCVQISKDCATCLYVSVVEDTGFFSYSNVNEQTFEDASALVKLGANPTKIASLLKSRLSLAKVRLLGCMLNDFELHFEAKIAFVYISNEVLQKTGAKRYDTKNIINVLRDIVIVQVAVMVLEEKNGGFKVSIRSKEEIDISALAQKFGGGGHKNAVGFEVANNDFNDLKEKILKKIEDKLDE
jgi:phosphoesterase RecJ-like protein